MLASNDCTIHLSLDAIFVPHSSVYGKAQENLHASTADSTCQQGLLSSKLKSANH